MKFAVVLSGCGVFDGAEIHEAVMALYAIDRNGCEYQCFAPDIDQYHVVNHLTKQETTEKRNVLTEAARIARGKIQSLNEYKPENFDALLFPGGFGVAKNFCDFAFKGADCEINPVIENTIKNTVTAKKVIGAMCISPVMLAKIVKNAKITVGAEKGAGQAVGKMGASHVETTHEQIVVDQENRLVTAPCYMLDAKISHIANEADILVKKMIELIKK